MNKTLILTKIFVTIFFVCQSVTTFAQRIQQPLGRGVVAVYGKSNGREGVTITWRRLAQEPEDIGYNVYVSPTIDGEYRRINGQMLTNTNYSASLQMLPYGSYVAVSTVITKDGEMVESPLSKPFHFTNQGLRNIYMEISFEHSPLKMANYDTKFVWPCDLNSDGEYDYVVDRNPIDGTENHFVEAYLADGTYLWTVDLGINELSSSGQDDQICSYDIDCDGFGEVIVQTSDGTRFWDQQNNTWGKYLLGKDTADSDGDGIIDYNHHATRNAPKYMTVINGMTGEEKATIEQMYDDAYNRTNRATLMGEEYFRHTGHVGIFYHDGIHPAIVMEWHTRTTAGVHQYRNSAFAFDFTGGTASNWHQLFMKHVGGAEFHMIRIFDADGDGKDEMSSGAYCMDHDGNTLYNTGISHGDRHRTSDIDPERPGLETFSIQQNAPDMLGQILFDAGTGEAIKKWYLPAVGDVGRGECLDLDADHLGWEMFSTMDGYQIYDAQGNKIDGMTGYFPTEGIWWDGQLDRENVNSPDGNGYNAMIVDYRNGRLIEMAKESGWTIQTSFGKRGKYWGDIIGDWREELVLNRVRDGVNVGIVGFTTDCLTDINNIYCLQQDPHYRGDCTTRGYYQSPNPGFYLGYDMPRPQLPPCMVADEKNEVFDLSVGDATVTPRGGVENVYAMPVKGQKITIDSTLEGDVNLWKSQQGTLEFIGQNMSEGKTIISEGTLELNGYIEGTVELRARGTLSGMGSVGNLVLEGALNYEGCRIKPSDLDFIIRKGLNVDKRLFIELDDVDEDIPAIEVFGDLSVTAPCIFTFNKQPAPGKYALISASHHFNYPTGMQYFSARGLQGLSYSFGYEANGEEGYTITLTIHEQRAPSDNVIWTASTDNNLNYQSDNFAIDGEPTSFVAGDDIVFDDSAAATTVNVAELFPMGSVTFANDTKSYVIQGDGGFSGEGGVTFNGKGRVTLNAVNSDYTGPTVINAGTVTVKELADAGVPSSLGAASASAANLKIGNATLIINNTNTATNRGIMLTDTATVQIASGTAAFKGIISGEGVLRKNGAGQINITYSGANTWKSTILNGGTLAMGAWNTTFGKANSTIHVTGNSTITMFDSNNSSALPNFQNAVNIDKNRTLTFHAGSRCMVKGSLLGSGTFKIDFPYVRGDVYTDVSGFEGTYEVASANCRFVQAMDFSKATLKLDAGAYAAGFKAGSGNEAGMTHKIGALSGTGTLGTGTWNVGYLGKNESFAGVFNSAAVVNKYGDGMLTLTASSASPINIIEGTLIANCNTAPTTVGAINVRNGGKLAGTGLVQNVNVQGEGTIGAGVGSVMTSSLTIKGNLSVAQNGRIAVKCYTSATASRSDVFRIEGNATLNSPVFDMSFINDVALCDDAELKILDVSGRISLTGTVTMLPERPKAGFAWDLSRLETDGIISVVADEDGIAEVETDGESGAVYDLLGRRVPAEGKGLHISNGRKTFKKR